MYNIKPFPIKRERLVLFRYKYGTLLWGCCVINCVIYNDRYNYNLKYYYYGS